MAHVRIVVIRRRIMASVTPNAAIITSKTLVTVYAEGHRMRSSVLREIYCGRRLRSRGRLLERCVLGPAYRLTKLADGNLPSHRRGKIGSYAAGVRDSSRVAYAHLSCTLSPCAEARPDSGPGAYNS